jgi:hypothetical protein
MCHVQRVTNTCGHRNDHIIMACYIVKEASPSPDPSPTSASSPQGQQSAETHTHQSSSACCCSNQAQTQNQDQDTAAASANANPDDKIARTGFDARTQPYCINAFIKELDSPAGFKCMVYRCGRAD